MEKLNETPDQNKSNFDMMLNEQTNYDRANLEKRPKIIIENYNERKTSNQGFNEGNKDNLNYLLAIDNDKRLRPIPSIKERDFDYGQNSAQPEKKHSLTKKEVDEIRNLLEFTYKNVADNKETTKKFIEEADNLTDKVRELQKMHEFLGNSSFIKKLQSQQNHRVTKSHDSPEFPRYTDRLDKLYSPISSKPTLDLKDDQSYDPYELKAKEKSAFI